MPLMLILQTFLKFLLIWDEDARIEASATTLVTILGISPIQYLVESWQLAAMRQQGLTSA